jgi:dTDP-4-amino-4,6-dideoxygalactose transaminase
MQKAYADMQILPDAFPLARDLAREVLSLPMGPQLGLDQVHDTIVALQNAR